MSSIQIGSIIATNRKSKGITQEELANHLGVSKPAVSKWESGQSYPDILLLPELAAYFNITVDQLIGYEPQMTKEEIKKLYNKLAKDFVKGPFERVYSECEEQIRKYFSCWNLQFQIALLLLNHANLAGGQDRIKEIVERALDLFQRVEKSGDDVALAKQALQLEALCYLSLQKPVEAIDILENMQESMMQPETMLVKAYQMKGDQSKAIEHLQGYTYINLLTLLGSAPDYFMMYADQPERMEQYYGIFNKLSDIFEVEELHPAILFNIYLAAATVFVMQGKVEEALEALEHYTGLAIKFVKEKFRIHGNRLFDALEGYLSSVDVKTDAPRSMEVINRDIRNAIISNPSFTVLESEERFQRIKKKLEMES